MISVVELIKFSLPRITSRIMAGQQQYVKSKARIYSRKVKKLCINCLSIQKYAFKPLLDMKLGAFLLITPKGSSDDHKKTRQSHQAPRAHFSRTCLFDHPLEEVATWWKSRGLKGTIFTNCGSLLTIAFSS